MRTERGTRRSAPRRGVRPAGANDERLRAFRQAFVDHVELPTAASVIDEPVGKTCCGSQFDVVC